MTGESMATSRVGKLLAYAEIATNVAVLLTTVFVAILLVRPYLVREGAAATALRPGTPLPLDGSIEYERADRTVVLALDAQCRFCAESGAFYKALAGRIGASAGKTQIVAIFPNGRADAADFMARHELAFPFREMATLELWGVQRTPTLIVVDRSGKILQTWVGKLGNETRKEVAWALNLD